LHRNDEVLELDTVIFASYDDEIFHFVKDFYAVVRLELMWWKSEADQVTNSLVVLVPSTEMKLNLYRVLLAYFGLLLTTAKPSLVEVEDLAPFATESLNRQKGPFVLCVGFRFDRTIVACIM
jgi:hypothetical protein